MSFPTTEGIITAIHVAIQAGQQDLALSLAVRFLQAVVDYNCPAVHRSALLDLGCEMLTALHRLDMGGLDYVFDRIFLLLAPEVIDLTEDMDIEEDPRGARDLLCREVLAMLDEESEATVEDDKDSDYYPYEYLCLTCSRSECNCNDIISLPPPDSPVWSPSTHFEEMVFSPPEWSPSNPPASPAWSPSKHFFV